MTIFENLYANGKGLAKMHGYFFLLKLGNQERLSKQHNPTLFGGLLSQDSRFYDSETIILKTSISSTFTECYVT